MYVYTCMHTYVINLKPSSYAISGINRLRQDKAQKWLIIDNYNSGYL